MMVPVADDEDDFIVQSAADEETSAPSGTQEDTPGWQFGLKKLGGLMFAKGAEPVAEPEPTLPVGFSAILNAEEEEIYPAESKMKVLFAEESLAGRNRRQAAEQHQALQQVVGAAAIYNHFLAKHGGVGTRPKKKAGVAGGRRDSITSDSGERGGTFCTCGGTTGSCKAISSLLEGEMNKIAQAAEKDRRGEMLKKFRQVERRSGGLCNPELIQKVVRSSSTDANTPSPNLRSAPPSPAPSLTSPGHLDSSAMAASNLVVEDGGEMGVAIVGDAAQDIPWADDMLSLAVRKRNAAMLKVRGRALAKGLARMLTGVSKELKGVASRLPPWEEEDEEAPSAQEEMSSLNRIQSRGNVFGTPESRSSFSSSMDGGYESSEKAPSPSAPGGGGNHVGSTVDLGGNGRPPTRPPGAVSAVAAAVAAVANVVAPAGGGSAAEANRGAADEVKNRRLDWKLSAQELSLIRKEEERVMKPEVLAMLLAKGAGLGCLQQADFWDVFARLEVVTRTEALLNLAIRGGRGCAERSGRMGRELCMSLTSVVLEAISVVEEDKLQSQPQRSVAKPPSQQQQQQQLRHVDVARQGDRSLHEHQQSAAVENRRPSSERLPRESMVKVEGNRARAGSVGLLASRPRTKENVSGASGTEGVFYKEDPGLKGLDRREEEFRKAIFVYRRALATRLMRLIQDARLCSRVLGMFVDDSVKKATHVGRTPAHPRGNETGTDPTLDISENSASLGLSKPSVPEAPPAPAKLLAGDAATSSTPSSKASTGAAGNYGESQPSPSVSSLSSACTDPLSERDSDFAAATAVFSLSSSGEQARLTPPAAVVEEPAALPDVNQVSEDVIEVETVLV